MSLENGKKVLNAHRANYSYGLLQRVFELAFHKNPPQLKPPSRVLMLGFGGGCVAMVLRKAYNFQGKLTGVEIDPVIIQLARKHFPEVFEWAKLIEGDAFRYVEERKQRYELIIVDLFKGNRPSAGSYSEDFLRKLSGHLKGDGRIYHNLMLEHEELKKARKNYQKFFESVEVLYLLGLNQVIVAEGPTS